MSNVIAFPCHVHTALHWFERKLAYAAVRFALAVLAVGFAAALVLPFVGYGCCWVLYEITGTDQCLVLTVANSLPR